MLLVVTCERVTRDENETITSLGSFWVATLDVAGYNPGGGIGIPPTEQDLYHKYFLTMVAWVGITR